MLHFSSTATQTSTTDVAVLIPTSIREQPPSGSAPLLDSVPQPYPGPQPFRAPSTPRPAQSPLKSALKRPSAFCDPSSTPHDTEEYIPPLATNPSDFFRTYRNRRRRRTLRAVANLPPPPDWDALEFHSDSSAASPDDDGKLPASRTRKPSLLPFHLAGGNSFGTTTKVIEPVCHFPQNTSGFLYYHRPPNATPLEGDVRFRCTPTPSPSSFAAGHDLLLPWGGPWQILIPQLARRKEIAAQLVQQQLVPQAQLSRATELFGTKHIHLPSILFRLNGEFRLNFTKNLYLQAVGEDAVHELAFVLDFCGKYRDTGSAVARFEPSIVDNRPVVHMRIVRLVEPFVRELHDPAHRYVEPREGELLILVNPGGHSKPWTFDLKRKIGPAVGLRALWNASRKASSIS
ncbi:hypothetical protein C8R46DRAFT_1215127 [Mycena filopes]|nr:hypothetical protein C8R46DRAFT_1215127 [Mycena filopes]